jgi:hypothetical protein
VLLFSTASSGVPLPLQCSRFPYAKTVMRCGPAGPDFYDIARDPNIAHAPNFRRETIVLRC